MSSKADYVIYMTESRRFLNRNGDLVTDSLFADTYRKEEVTKFCQGCNKGYSKLIAVGFNRKSIII